MSARTLFTTTSLLSVEDSEYFVIDAQTRAITLPTGFTNFGVESDENAKRVYFKCPRYVGDNLDLTTLNLRVNYQNANGDKDKYLVTDVTVDGENVVFSWLLSRKATMYSGVLSFIVCAVKVDSSGAILNEWNTTLCRGDVLGGLEVENPEITEEVSDLISQLVNLVNDSITSVETLASESVANVKSAEAQAIEAVKNTPNSLFANAIKGNVSGEVVRVDDVSPVEHTVGVKVRSKNLCKFSGSGVKNGLTYSYENGVWTIQGTPTIAYAGIESMSITNMLEDGETYTVSQSQYFAGSSAAGAVYLQVLIEDYEGKQTFVLSVVGARSFTVDKSKYKRYILTLQCGTALQEVSVSNFTVQLEKGDTATEYTPYVDPSTVTLSQCGKNLLTTPYHNGSSRETNGITFTVNEDGSVTAKGTATAAAWFTLSTTPFEEIIPNYWKAVARQDCSYNSENGVTSIFINAGETVDKVYYPQMEIGSNITGFEKGVELVTYTPDSEGNVNAVSVAPTMTLFTDTEGVTVECEYTRDSNVVIADLIKRVAALESGV